MQPLAIGVFDRTRNLAAAVFGPADDAGTDWPVARVLLVEDEYFVAVTTEAWLTNAGFEVVASAASAEEAVRFAHELRPDLILMDIRLLGARNGIDAAIEIVRSTGIRSLFVSANDDPAMRLRAAQAKPWGWLSKPYESTQLIGAIKKALSELREQS